MKRSKKRRLTRDRGNVPDHKVACKERFSTVIRNRQFQERNDEAVWDEDEDGDSEGQRDVKKRRRRWWEKKKKENVSL